MTVAPSQVPAPPAGNVDKGPLINIFDTWIVALDVICIVLRFVTRIFITEPKIWWDDWFILVSLVCILIGASGNAVEVHYGFGRPEHYLTDYQVRYYVAWTYGEWIQTMLTLMCTKVSICFFLLRVPATASKKLTYPLWASIVVLLVSNVILTLLWAFQCKPIKAVWDFEIPHQCFSHNQILQMILAQALISIISDFGLSLFPIVILHKLNMRFKAKLGIGVLMGLGLITGACSIVRTVLNGKSLAQDATYGGITNWFWRLFEVDLGLICACIPTLVPLWKWTLTKVKKMYAGSRFKSYIPRPSMSAGKPSISLGKSSGKPSKGSLGGIALAERKPDWEEKNVKQPKKAMLASRTERALMGRAGGGYDDLSTMHTEFAPETETGTTTTTTAGGSTFQAPQTDAERHDRAQEWENALRMPWMPENQRSHTQDFARDIEIGRSTSLTVTLEDAAKGEPDPEHMEGYAPRHPLINARGPPERNGSVELERHPPLDNRRYGGLWGRVVTAVVGGEHPAGQRGSWRRMHTPSNSRG